MSRGEVATAILKAILLGGDYPPEGVEDTPHNRQVWDAMKRDVGNVPPGDVVDIPSDV
ncbi:MAG: hypothetical protein ACRDPY_09710 [Streptosporangiaceae bacterium]